MPYYGSKLPCYLASSTAELPESKDFGSRTKQGKTVFISIIKIDILDLHVILFVLLFDFFNSKTDDSN